MATLIKTDGTVSTVTPKNGTDYKLEELKRFVGGYIEIIYLTDDKIMVINEEGKFQCEPNLTATIIARRNYSIAGSDYIAGNALICLSKEVL